jgi:hypothetical protein
MRMKLFATVKTMLAAAGLVCVMAWVGGCAPPAPEVKPAAPSKPEAGSAMSSGSAGVQVPLPADSKPAESKAEEEKPAEEKPSEAKPE